MINLVDLLKTSCATRSKSATTTTTCCRLEAVRYVPFSPCRPPFFACGKMYVIEGRPSAIPFQLHYLLLLGALRAYVDRVDLLFFTARSPPVTRSKTSLVLHSSKCFSNRSLLHTQSQKLLKTFCAITKTYSIHNHKKFSKVFVIVYGVNYD